MNQNQTFLYFREWQKARRILRTGGMTPDEADQERHALHIKALGHDKSSTRFNNADLDEVLKVFRAISDPGNAKTQVELEQMPATRKRAYIRQILGALGRDDDYAESIAARMQRNRKQKSTGAGSMLTLDTMQEGDLVKVMIALKKECRRRWETKDILLCEIATVQLDNDFPEAATAAAVMRELRAETMPALATLVYEDLLTVLSTLLQLAHGKMRFPQVGEMGFQRA